MLSCPSPCVPTKKYKGCTSETVGEDYDIAYLLCRIPFQVRWNKIRLNQQDFLIATSANNSLCKWTTCFCCESKLNWHVVRAGRLHFWTHVIDFEYVLTPTKALNDNNIRPCKTDSCCRSIHTCMLWKQSLVFLFNFLYILLNIVLMSIERRIGLYAIQAYCINILLVQVRLHTEVY